MYSLVGGFSPTKIEKYTNKSIWIISPSFRGENQQLFELPPPSSYIVALVRTGEENTFSPGHAKKTNLFNLLTVISQHIHALHPIAVAIESLLNNKFNKYA